MIRYLAVISMLAVGGCDPKPEVATESLESRFDDDTTAVSVRYADGTIETELFDAQRGLIATATWYADDQMWEWSVAGLGDGAYPLAAAPSMEQGNLDLHAMWLALSAQRGDTPYLYSDDPWEMCRQFPGVCNCTFPPCPWEQDA